jgi:hypothetical protein
VLYDFFHPDLSLSAQALLRSAYGVLMVLTLLQGLPEARRFFLSERWGGYAKSSSAVDALQNPFVIAIILAAWMAAAITLTLGRLSPWPALVNVVFCRYFFVHMRWRSLTRGMGAPGFMSYWTGLVVFLLEYTSHFAPEIRHVALLVAVIDLALIMLSAGVYKATAGYPRNHGMELGLCNPMWGYWWRLYATLPPNHWIIWTLNQLAWGTEVALAICILIPPLREPGGLLLVFSFAFIATQIRLGFLTEMVIVSGLLCVAPGGLIDDWIAGLVAPPVAASVPNSATIAVVNRALEIALWTYLASLPLAHAGLYYNFYARQRLPQVLQRALERYTNLFGIIIWRVFSVDLVNFYVRIQAQPRAGGTRRLVGQLGTWPRFNHVGEMICLTSVFTTLKYYPSNADIFRERLLRYARTLPHRAGDVLIFEYLSVVKEHGRFDWVPTAEYRVDLEDASIDERILAPGFSPRSAHPASPVHEGATPGSYAPARPS